MTVTRHPARFLAFLIFLLLVAALTAAASLKPRPTARHIRQQLAKELQPVVLKNCTLERVGGVYDGGYLMCGNLLGDVESSYSYGIGPWDEWGCQISARLRVPVHQYDCFDPGRPVCWSGLAVFHDECIGDRRARIEGRAFDTLQNQILRNGDGGKTLVAKIDIEGAEETLLVAAPGRVLDRIDQLAMEIHGTNRDFLRMVLRLKRHFYLVHVHFNNQACDSKSRPLPAWAYQVLFVNKRIGVPDPAASPVVLPRSLDAPDWFMGRDCQGFGPIEP